MTVPGRADAARLLLTLDPPPWFLRHSVTVADIAGWLAVRTAAAGRALDRRLVEAAALLHDVDKLVPDADPARGLRHGEGSADWLTRAGCAELAGPVAAHPVTRLADDRWFRPWLDAATNEERIVAYADKRGGQRLEPMSARFAGWARRYTGDDRWSRDEREEIRQRAERLEAAVCAAAGVAARDVRRLRWAGSALRRARSAA